MKPKIEINIDLNNGEIEKWGLTTDDSCVVVMRLIDGEWQYFKSAYVPSYVAQHMSALAVIDIAERNSFDAAFHVMHPPKHDGDNQSLPPVTVSN